MSDKRQFYINGQWVAALGGQDYQVINPSDETVCATICLGGKADTDAAIAAAREAQPGWAATPPAERARLVGNLSGQYERRKEELAQTISTEVGAPIDLARGHHTEVFPAHLRNFLAAFQRTEWLSPLGDQAPHSAVSRHPAGVVGMITPWNWPVNQISLKIIPAMLAGCTCVLKPSEVAPLNAMLLAEFCHDAGIPPGVFNLVNGDGAGVGTDLATHPDVDMISFTGSTRAGKTISRAAASTLKRVALELGGKGANLIFADADEGAIFRSLKRMMTNSGQSCNAPSRMLVERPVYEETIRKVAALTSAIRVASAHESGTHIGPVVSKSQWERVQNYIQQGIDEGARLVTGGLGLPPGIERGYFVRPTIFADVRPGMVIEREEIFGPVMAIMPFDSEEEAIHIANNTRYGLSNYVQTGDPARANRLALRLRSGVVEMNGYRRGDGSFFGGVKQSGHSREGGIWGIEEFLETKLISGWDFTVSQGS